MTIEEFNKRSFCAGDKFKYHGEWHNVASVNFDEALLAYDMADDEEEDMCLSWLRCESIEEFKPYKTKNMILDFTYCPGRCCSLLTECKRYNRHAEEAIPKNEALWWTEPAYDKKARSCPNFIKKN